MELLFARANISVTAYRISTEFKLPVPDVGRYARSLSITAGDVAISKTYLRISGSPKNAYICIPSFARVTLRRPAPFDTPVPRKAINVFEVTTRPSTMPFVHVSLAYSCNYVLTCVVYVIIRRRHKRLARNFEKLHKFCL